ncbi:conserved hypothetical protein [Vibrio chagasii]|nr:conserved hypothetical protein [Vibrio chagasii]CAK2170798.1 conserved hypothetical protein [Vibrio crassostreae]CAH7395411.1 conserved hypothetical protein [Vibrio chagasii]CAH7437629.1 conserved hypothetical protein [Vibrio chagasii]CAH7438059.1 conserved hypothetical protein [Vibrio chagasii]
MHENLERVPEHLMKLGIGMLAQAQKNSLYTGRASYLDEGVFAVLQAAQSAEILIKAAIAQEHPLLIFSKVPSSKLVDGELLSIEHVFEKGQTIKYSDLPEKLWAVTGYKLQEQDTFLHFGKLRNTIHHFALPNDEVDLRRETIQFIYKVIDPLLKHFWKGSALNHFDIFDSMDDIQAKLLIYGIDVGKEGVKIS